MDITIRPITSRQDLLRAETRIEEIWEAQPDTPEYYELEILSLLVAEYERKLHPLEELNPIETIKFRMEQMGINQAQLAKLAFNGHRGRVTDILNHKRKLNLSMVRKLTTVLRVDPKFLIKEY